jgi:CheY-like chemotaxis protein
VFEPFFTTKQNGRGTGLGLATCWDLMAQAGGRMSVESKVGRGSTFRVLLPIAEARLEEAPELSSASSGVQRALRGETVLVVEDYPVVRQLARRVLEQAGYAVLEAESSARALELASDSARHIDLLLTDVVMPLMGGAELAEHVRKLHPRARILFVSGYGPDELRRREGTPTGAHFLQKPLTPEKLGRAVRLALDEVVSLGEKGS